MKKPPEPTRYSPLMLSGEPLINPISDFAEEETEAREKWLARELGMSLGTLQSHPDAWL